MTDAISTPVIRLLLDWAAATKPHLFPLMKEEPLLCPLTATETQSDFWGLYEPPFGSVGKAVNAIVGRRIADLTGSCLALLSQTFGKYVATRS